MALPSQGGFSSFRSGGMYRRRRRRRGVSWLFVIIAALCATWILLPNDKNNETSDSFETPVQRVEQLATPPEIPDPVVTKEQEIIEEPIEVVLAPVVNVEPIKDTLETPTISEEPIAQIQPIPLAATTSSTALEEGLQLLDNGLYTEARFQLSKALLSGVLTESEASKARGILTDISDTLVFSRSIIGNDPYSLEYIVRGGDTLSGIVHDMGLQVDWRFIQRINGIKRASSIRPGQNIKLVTGPFHAVVTKDMYRIDVYLGDGDERVFVRSYPVGLGEYNSTSTGMFIVRDNSKLINPTWINPRTRQFYAADNPDNPIGERWIGLKGADERTKDLSGLGIHGTIEPQTIGTQSSMGCIRMHSTDIAQIYEILFEGVSTIQIK